MPHHRYSILLCTCKQCRQLMIPFGTTCTCISEGLILLLTATSSWHVHFSSPQHRTSSRRLDFTYNSSNVQNSMSESSEEEEVMDSLLFAVCFIGNQLHKVLQPVSVFFHGEKGAMWSIYTSWLSFCPYHTGVYSCIPEETEKVCMWKCLFVPCVHIKCCKHFHTWFGSEADNYLHVGRTEHNCPP